MENFEEKIEEVVLFTNKTVMIFAKNGLTHPLQQKINEWRSYNEGKIVEKLINDKPEFKLSRWQQWIHSINIEEFVLLTGLYPDYINLLEKRTNNQD